jgi:hypothetical protein
MTTFAKLLGWFALAVFLAALGLHVAGYVPGTPLALGWAKWMHVAAFGCFLAVAAHLAALQKIIRRRMRDEQAVEPWLDAHVPRWLWRVGGVFFVYVIASAAFYGATHEGQANVVNGAYALTSHGKVVREVSEPEFRDAERLEVRGVSGHWMLFSAIPAAYFLVVYPRARAALDAPRPNPEGAAA